jgi:CTP synthase
MQKFIVVTGGVLSGLGKGVTTASIGRILQSKGYSVVPIKIDGYVNTDAGTMNPFEHGEVFVTDDGGEIDLDIGHYERFLDISLAKENNMTTGQVYGSVIEKERAGEYLGKTIQVIPHITDEIKKRIKSVARKTKADFVMIEVGGTVGDLENMVFIEALREMRLKDPENFLFIHLTLVPTIISGEQKTKPTQHSVKELLSLGIQPDIVVCRSDKDIPKKLRQKIALFCSIPAECVFSNPDLNSLYEVPIKLEDQGISTVLFQKLGLEQKEEDLVEWRKFVEKERKLKETVKIAIVGKYTHLEDAYLSIKEALHHAGLNNNRLVDIKWIESEELYENGPEEYLDGVDGLIIPGGFGSRGTEGKIKAIKYAREKNIPLLGICYGLHMTVIEFARNVCGLKNAYTTECEEKGDYPVIDLMEEQKRIKNMGGTMRLGAYKCKLKEGSLARKLYGEELISERHRHRWEVNNKFHDELEKGGIIFSGINPQSGLVEIIELPSNDYFIAVQFHPEFKSRPEKPAPLFDGLVKAAIKKQDRN